MGRPRRTARRPVRRPRAHPGRGRRPGPGRRQVAAALLADAPPERPPAPGKRCWATRAARVRRSAVDAIAGAERQELRPLLERALQTPTRGFAGRRCPGSARSAPSPVALRSPESPRIPTSACASKRRASGTPRTSRGSAPPACPAGCRRPAARRGSARTPRTRARPGRGRRRSGSARNRSTNPSVAPRAMSRSRIVSNASSDPA